MVTLFYWDLAQLIRNSSTGGNLYRAKSIVAERFWKMYFGGIEKRYGVVGMEHLKSPSIRDFAIGQKASFTKTVTETDVMLFAGITGDFNPLHVDKEFASNTRFGQRVAHGILTLGLVSAAISRLAAGAIYVSQEVRFIKPVFIGDTVTASVEVAEIVAEKERLALRTVCTKQDEEMVLDGTALIKVPAQL